MSNDEDKQRRQERKERKEREREREREKSSRDDKISTVTIVAGKGEHSDNERRSKSRSRDERKSDKERSDKHERSEKSRNKDESRKEESRKEESRKEESRKEDSRKDESRKEKKRDSIEDEKSRKESSKQRERDDSKSHKEDREERKRKEKSERKEDSDKKKKSDNTLIPPIKTTSDATTRENSNNPVVKKDKKFYSQAPLSDLAQSLLSSSTSSEDKLSKRQKLLESVRLESTLESKEDKQREQQRAVRKEKEKAMTDKQLNILDNSKLAPTVTAKSELLEVLSDVKMKIQDRLHQVDFPIPQFIIIGKQSVGKSRLIEALAGEQFNFVSGTLGSRRPTILEFLNTPDIEASVWSVRNPINGVWESHNINRVMEILAEAHEGLGSTVSAEPIWVRVKSPYCVDMQVVDLPGFREFSLDNSKEVLAKKIEDLNLMFMKDERNVMICVEEAGDAANMSTLMKCKALDAKFGRTVLVRNKLDKYYGDLTFENCNNWLDGYGDLPSELTKFTLTLPHWVDKDREGNKLPPPMPFALLRDRMSDFDVKELASKGVSEKYLSMIGFINFARFMEQKIEHLFSSSIGPIVKRLKELRTKQDEAINALNEEMIDTNPESVSTTIRDCGMSFAHALNHVMEGVVSSTVKRLSLEQELELFHSVHSDREDLELFPCNELNSLPKYIEYLRTVANVPAMDMPVNGGAMYRRLMVEVEVFLRFAEISRAPSKEDVVQARGVSMGQLTWRDVIVKLLSNEAHLPMRRRVRYVGERIKFFFAMQKDVTLDFMSRVKGSHDEHMFSALYTKHCCVMASNELIKNLVFSTYDSVVDRQMLIYFELFHATMSSTFANPWVFLKKNSAKIEDGEYIEDIATFEETCIRIPWEIESRGGIEAVLSRWVADVPCEPLLIDEAVSKVRGLITKTFGFIRSQLADQMELYAEAFFKLPMMRKMEEDMNSIDLDDLDKEMYRKRRSELKEKLELLRDQQNTITHCLERLQLFASKTKSKKL